MDNIYYLLILIGIIIYIFIYINHKNTVYITAPSGKRYLIYRDNLKLEKVELLDNIVFNMFLLKNYLVNNIKYFPDFNEYILQLNQYFNENRTTIYETDPTSSNTSYSVNKGEEVSFCLKSKKNGNIHNINLLMYVAIHEMAHFACPEIGHTDLFKKIFKFFIKQAIKLGIYNKIDFPNNPTEYCGMTLRSSIV